MWQGTIMAIYKSSFNKKPEKERPVKKEKPKKEVVAKVKDTETKTKHKVNKAIVSLIVFSIIFLVCILPSNFIKNFILGVVGLLVYPVCVLGIVFSIFFLKQRRIKVKRKYVAYLVSALTVIWFIFHLILTHRLPMDNYGVFLAQSYLAKTTAGGLLFSLISYPIVKLLTIVGAYIFSAIALAVLIGLIIDYIIVERSVGHAEPKSKFDFRNIEDFEMDEQPKEVSKEEQQKQIAKRRLGLEKGETTVISSSMPGYDGVPKRTESRPMSKREYILTPLEPIIPPEENVDDLFLDNTTGYFNSKKVVRPENTIVKNDTTVSKQNTDIESNVSNDYDLNSSRENEYKTEQKSAPVEIVPDESFETPTPIEKVETKTYNIFDDMAPADEQETEEDEYADIFEDTSSDELDYTELPSSDDLEEDDTEIEQEEQADDYSTLENMDESYSGETTEVVEDALDEQSHEYIDEYSNTIHTDNLGSTTDREEVRSGQVDISQFHLPNMANKQTEKVEQVKIDDIKPKEEIPPYVAPPVDLLNYMETTGRISEEELQDNIDRLEQVLEDFRVPAKVNNVQVGPAVTRYELTMPRGISVNKIVQMADDIAMTLASNGSIRVEAPIPGKNSVGIEVPNNQVTPVSLRELIDSNEFRVRGNPMSFVLGKDINGDIIFCNLDKMPHVLVAGSTGSGKSVCLNTMLLSMCYKSGPQDLRLILVDPKMVEFSTYNGLPHLLIPEVITGKDMTINALDWAIREMERRYALFAKNHVVNINEFNKLEMVKNKVVDKLPFIVVVVDELADLMLEAKREIEDRIAKLAAKARAAGIHLVLATQRPSVDVITGTVKTNLPSRIAFALTNYMDSKTVLDGGGAEKLLGKGDMLFKPQDKPEPRRIQGAFVSNAEISAVVQFIKDHNKPVYDDDTGRAIRSPHQANTSSHDSNSLDEQEFDPVLKDALRLFIQNKQASASMISRRYSVGFNRAGRIMDQMERAGFIGPQDGSKPRQVLITMEQFNAIFGED